MNEVLNCLETRRSCRAYRPEQVPEEALQEILRAGLYAPSGMGRQSVKLLVVQDPAAITAVEDGSLALGNLMNAAHSLGIASCWIHRAREVFASAEGKALLQQWGVEGEWIGIGHCFLGYAAEPEKPAAPRLEGRIVRI